MQVLLVVVVGLVTAIVFVALTVISRERLGSAFSAKRRPQRDDESHALRAEAAAAMEEHDIDDMFDAILERCRARGRRELGDAVADELLREEPPE